MVCIGSQQFAGYCRILTGTATTSWWFRNLIPSTFLKRTVPIDVFGTEKYQWKKCPPSLWASISQVVCRICIYRTQHNPVHCAVLHGLHRDSCSRKNCGDKEPVICCSHPTITPVIAVEGSTFETTGIRSLPSIFASRYAKGSAACLVFVVVISPPREWGIALCPPAPHTWW